MEPPQHGLVAVSAAMGDLVRTIEHLARYSCPVLILGEAGSGKEAVAEVLHALGPYRERALVKLNCASLTGASKTPHLFGSARAGFGGSATISPEGFLLVEGGSLLLDEVNELPFNLQSKLIRVVENPGIQTGPCGTVHPGVRVMASTNHDLAAMVKAGDFRADLYYRLAAASCTVPPLRERRADIRGLIADMIASYNRQFGKQVDRISADALALLHGYRWPGNLREMAQGVERAMLFCDDGRIDAGDLPAAVRGDGAGAIETSLAKRSGSIAGDGARISGSWPRTREHAGHRLDDALKAAIERSLVAAGGDCSRAAAIAGVSRVTFQHKMIRYGLTAKRRERSSADERDAAARIPSH
jgi:DNA-binding NtrC family response regulator